MKFCFIDWTHVSPWDKVLEKAESKFYEGTIGNGLLWFGFDEAYFNSS